MISKRISFTPKFEGLPLLVTMSAQKELLHNNCDLWDVKHILTEGYDCSASKRKRNIKEKCIRKGNKTYKVVIAKCYAYHEDKTQTKVWRIVHFGKFTYKKRKTKSK